jgi:predicted nucleotidyltransferase
MINPTFNVSPEATADSCPQRRIRRLSLFGSAICSDFEADGEVDVLVEPAENTETGLFQTVSMEDELSAIFGRNVDLVTREAMEQSRNPIRRHILGDLESAYAAGFGAAARDVDGGLGCQGARDGPGSRGIQIVGRVSAA